MKKFHVKIKANPIFPFYMQHRMDDQKLDEWEKSRGKIIDNNKSEDEKLSEFHAYRNNKGYFMPAAHIHGAMISAGGMLKAKVGNAKKSMANIVSGQFYVTPDEILISPQNKQIDKRSAVNRNIKARIITVRPKWENWSVEFDIIVDNDTISMETVKEILTIAGSNIGIGSFRPANKGQFGRFIIEKIDDISE